MPSGTPSWTLPFWNENHGFLVRTDAPTAIQVPSRRAANVRFSAPKHEEARGVGSQGRRTITNSSLERQIKLTALASRCNPHFIPAAAPVALYPTLVVETRCACVTFCARPYLQVRIRCAP